MEEIFGRSLNQTQGEPTSENVIYPIAFQSGKLQRSVISSIMEKFDMTPLVGVDHRHLARSMKGLMRLSSREQANSSPAIIRLNWHSDSGGKPESSPKGLFPLSNIGWQYVERLLNHIAALFRDP
ncbi:hypothetical protein A6X21_09620 [Planctopirus hydrillae]|uniref:Uncharacterized protein n=1 Tax=Planctopirus hydrillae TaxID=1841610 RepID=A0A1C3E7G5_9PLAN|nr:hypothetical protein A6X21_09620 [Planctopirus hydrillae]